MPVTASERRRAGLRIGAREIPVTWLSGAGLVALGVLLIAGDGPLEPALATFALGLVAALALTWLHGATSRYRVRRRAEAEHAIVLHEGIARLRRGLAADRPDAAELHELAAALAAVAGAPEPGPARSLAGLVRAAAALARPVAEARDVRLIVAVDDDAPVRGSGLELALGGLLRRAAQTAPPGTDVIAAIRSGRVEIRDAAPPDSGDRFPSDLARAVAHRAGGDLHLFDRADGPGTLAVLELPAAR